MAKSSTELTQSWFEAMDTIIGERISSLPYDQTIVCQIVDTTDHANGIYRVTHNFGTTFTAYADFTGYNENDFVYVRIPEGDYTQQKVITGKFLEGLIISGETQNLLVSPQQSYLLYDKNNQIHFYPWSQKEREITFTYFNSTKAEESWQDVLAQYTGGDMNYERANAIKLVINSERDIIVYLYKYIDETDGRFHFAAEQYNKTSPTFMPSIENKPAYIDVTSYAEVNQQKATFNSQTTYYIKAEDKYQVTHITEFNPTVTYYTAKISNKVPEGTELWQKNNTGEYYSILTKELDEENNIIYHYNFDGSKPVYYYSKGYLELDIPSSLSMITSARIYYDIGTEDSGSSPTGMVHLIYTIAPELDPNQTTIPVTIQYCPTDEYHNISASTSINFGYITELDGDINVVLQLIRNKDEVEEVVPAVIQEDDAEYYLRPMFIDKFGNKLKNDTFVCRWNHNTINDILSINNMDTMPGSPIVHTLEIGFNNNNEFWAYRTYYYPLAVRGSDQFYVECPDIITYDEAGINPQYYTGLIRLKSYNDAEQDYRLECDEHLFTVRNNIMLVYNIYSGTDEYSYLKFISNENNKVVWYQSLLFRQKSYEGTIQVKNFPKERSIETRSTGALAAQSAGTSGMILRYNNGVLSLEGYNQGQNGATPIFHLDSNGKLNIGYKNFTMLGHISEGAQYLEDNEKKKYKVGDNYTPIYFNEGIPITMPKLLEPAGGQLKILPSYNTSYITSGLSNGRFVLCESAKSFTLPENAEMGYECEICKAFKGDGIIQFKAATGSIDKLYCIDTPDGATILQLTEPYGVVAIKKIDLNKWLLTGSVEGTSTT